MIFPCRVDYLSLAPMGSPIVKQQNIPTDSALKKEAWEETAIASPTWARKFHSDQISELNLLLGPDRVSPIQPEDAGLYKSFFRDETRGAVYGNSWYYITQACRDLGLGWKYYDQDVLLSIGKHKEHFVIVCPLGTLDNRAKKLIDSLARASNRPVFIKKASPDQEELLCHLGCRKVSTDMSMGGSVSSVDSTFSWHNDSPADDDTFPEIIIDLEQNSQLSSKPADWLGCMSEARELDVKASKRDYRKYRGNIRSYNKEPIPINLLSYSPRDRQLVVNLLHTYFDGNHTESNRLAYINMLGERPAALRENEEWRFMVSTSGIGNSKLRGIVGFFCIERLDASSAGLYANIIHRIGSGFPEYVEQLVFSKLQAAGIRFLNLGGSETSDLHRYKRKRGAIEFRQTSMLSYEHD